MEFKDLKGKTLTSVEKIDNKGGDEIVFTLASGEKHRLHHWQDCCETVYIEDIDGDLSDLVDSPVTMAEESCKTGPVTQNGDDCN